ncbi:hypothetical protein GCM10009573_34230 [Agromyces bracchium]
MTIGTAGSPSRAIAGVEPATSVAARTAVTPAPARVRCIDMVLRRVADSDRDRLAAHGAAGLAVADEPRTTPVESCAGKRYQPALHANACTFQSDSLRSCEESCAFLATAGRK